MLFSKERPRSCGCAVSEIRTWGSKDENDTTVDSRSRGMEKAESLCRVCGDKASGRHYGVASCDGCRGFFKRSVRRSLEYACKEQGRCVVDVARRNQCQACRLKKCLAVCMRREAVQHERASRSQPRRRSRLVTSSSDAPQCYGPPIRPPLPLGPYCPPPPVEARINPSLLPRISPGALPFRRSEDEISAEPTLGIRDLKQPITAMAPPTKKPAEECISDDSRHSSPSSTTVPAFEPRLPPAFLAPFPPSPLDTVYEAAAKLLFFAVRWMRGIPSFLQLGFRDQAVLLEDSWCDVFVLSAAQWGFPLQEGFLSFAGLISPEKRPLVASQLHQMKNVMTQLVAQQVDHTEFSCLKALVLFRPEAIGLRDPIQVELLQDQTQLMLHEYVLTKQPPSKVRFGKLLLILSLVRKVNASVIEDIFFRKTIGAVPIERLLCDMFQAA